MPPPKKLEKGKTAGDLPAECSQSPTPMGFDYTRKHEGKITKHEKALRDAGYPWVMLYAMDQGQTLKNLTEEGKHIILLEKGKLKAERMARAWVKPLDKVETLDEASTGQRQLAVHANGTYELTAQNDSRFYEGHICLSPDLAYRMVECGRLKFYMGNGKAVATTALLDLLNETVLERKNKKGKMTVRVTVPNCDISVISKTIRNWFKTEWKQENYHRRCWRARALGRENLKDLYDTDSEDEEDGSANGKGKERVKVRAEAPDKSESEKDAEDEGSDYVEEN